MAKRKREEDFGDDCKGNLRQKRVQHQLQQGIARLGHAFKIAKGFERQKLGRRRKNAAKLEEGKIVDRIDGEIAAIKTLDTTVCAQHHLFKTLLKIKAVSASSDLPDEVRQVGTFSTDPARLNVHARLCKANTVKEVLENVIADVQKALGIEVMERDNVRVKKKRVRAEHFSREGVTAAVDVQRENLLRKDEVRRHDGNQRSEEEAGHYMSDSTEVPGHFPCHLTYSREDSNGDTEADAAVGNLERQLFDEGIRKSGAKVIPKAYNHAADLSLSDSEASSASPTPEPQKALAPKKSTFLPSLSMGGYISGSGSDIDDDIDVTPKKNRRGQRERRAIWEKKYGAKAKHLMAQNRNEGWDPKRGAIDKMDRHAKGMSKGGSRANRNDRRNGEGEHKTLNGHRERHRDDSGPIHPSWEAAKKAKEKKAAPVAFQGKKITFD